MNGAALTDSMAQGQRWLASKPAHANLRFSVPRHKSKTKDRIELLVHLFSGILCEDIMV